MDEFFERNRKNWDERAEIHVRDTTGFYRVDEFRNGTDTLGSVEAAEIGDLAGKSLLHLQCHFGLDSMNLARRGAQVTGLDFSPRAIDSARSLAAECGVEATFVEGNVYDAPGLIEGTFDRVYVTWGTICWLPDIRGWCRIIAGFLKPGGVFYFADCHPIAAILDEHDGKLVADYAWRTPTDAPLFFEEENSVTYTGDETPLMSESAGEWNHPLSDVLGGLMAEGLVIEMFNEHTVLPWPQFPMMIPAGQDLYRLPDGVPEIPLSFSLKARKPG